MKIPEWPQLHASAGSLMRQFQHTRHDMRLAGAAASSVEMFWRCVNAAIKAF